MAEPKVHKQEAPNKKELSPQTKKAIDLRASGLSLREIAEKLNISRKKVEEITTAPTPAPKAKASVKDAKDATDNKGK